MGRYINDEGGKREIAAKTAPNKRITSEREAKYIIYLIAKREFVKLEKPADISMGRRNRSEIGVFKGG